MTLLQKMRAGNITMEEALKLAEDFEGEIKDAYLHSKLPATPDQKAIDKLLLQIYRGQSFK